MFAIIGILLVFGAVIGGFLMEKDHLAVLVQPAEFLIIIGAALGTLLIANPIHTLKGIFAAALGVFGKSQYGRERYVSTLKMMFELLNKVRRSGMLSIEMDIEKPEESLLFKEYPGFFHDHHVRSFVCDTMRMAVTGGVDPFDLDQMMDLDMDVRHRCSHQPISVLTSVADSLPGLGIVAAVLGVVITMGALGGPPEAIGHKVAAALVGTFLGILLCYGLVGPIGSYRGGTRLSLCVARADDLLYQGQCPGAVGGDCAAGDPLHVRPTFEEVETACHGQQASEAAAEQKIA